MPAEVGNTRKNSIWIIDDNEFIVYVLSKGFQTEASDWEVRSFLKYNDALLALEEKKHLPNVILLDYDFGAEGTAKDFILGMDRIDLSLNCKIFIYSSTEYNTAFEEVLLHKQVFGWIEKPTPLNSLIDLLINKSNS